MNHLDSLARWNVWGQWQIPDSFERELKQQICPYLDTEEVIALVGARRSGKSTLLYQLMDHLLRQGIDEKAILHINFEEPSFTPFLDSQLLDKLYDTYRSKVYPQGRCYIFFDEIQNVPGWERWIRARNDTENIKLLITGSSSTLLSGELATVLSGRNFCFEVHPLSFTEFLSFKHIAIPQLTPLKKQLPAPAQIHYALDEYLQWGGFPRIALAKTAQEKHHLLSRYFDEIILKDVVQRHQIRNVMTLKGIAIHLLTNTATLTSFKRLADLFQVSQDLAQDYVNYLCEAYILKILPFYSLKAGERNRNPFKIHAVDLGLRKIASLSHSTDETKLIETQVHNALARRHQELYYWKGAGEIDILTREGLAISNLYQVTLGGLDNAKVYQREVTGLQKALNTFSKAKGHLITLDSNTQLKPEDENTFELTPLWQFLLN